MRTHEKKEGYGYLMNWAVRIGDLVAINGIIFLYFCFFGDNLSKEYVSFDHKEEMILFLFVNLIYFVTSFFVPLRLSLNVIHIDKVVQNSLYFVILYCTFLTCTLLLFNIITHLSLKWIAFCAVLILMYTVWHVLFRVFLKEYRRKGYNFKTVVLVGAGNNGAEIYNELKGSDYGYKVLGYYDDKPDEEHKDFLPKYLGTVNDLTENRPGDLDEIYCTLFNRDAEIKSLIALSERNMLRFFIIPNFYRYTKRKLSLSVLNTIPILSIRQEPLQYLSNRIIKRTFDIIFSLAVLCIIFPTIYIIFGAIIKLTSPGNVFFKQKRTGIKGNEFDCYKFRSMQNNEVANLQSATKGDPRVTKIGAFMRKTNIDELPQFINVLKGDMSIVGPRPHMLSHTDMYSSIINQFMVRHLVKPGITGWAQVTGMRGEIETVEDMVKRVQKDVWYIENWSFFLDLKIIFLTGFNMIRGEEKAY